MTPAGSSQHLIDVCGMALADAMPLVMCEKPLTPTAAEAEELFKIAKANKRILGVYQNRRWDGDFLTVRKLIQDNSVS